MRVSSAAFKDGGTIPTKHAYHGVPGGQNVSLPLVWSDTPSGTKSFALSIVDLHPVARNWVHWFVINIPPGDASLAEGASGKNMPTGSKELNNSYGTLGYGGPQPPKGTGSHTYEVTVYALNVDRLDLPITASLQSFQKALEGTVIASAKTTGTYEQ